MRTPLSVLIAIVIFILALTACSKTTNSPAAASSTPASSNPADPIEKKLLELAGAGATNCGRLQSQTPAQMDPAAQCATDAAAKKLPFYIAYELPGMIIAMAGNADGKLFTLQGSGTSVAASGPCPSELRVAPSGRITCFAPGTFGMGMDATHGGGMTMPPASGANPHQGLGIPPPGQVNPHQPKSATTSVK